jgi:hypothetical protein
MAWFNARVAYREVLAKLTRGACRLFGHVLLRVHGNIEGVL